MPKNKTEVAVDDSEKKPSRKWLFIIVAVLLSVSALAGGLVMSMGTEKLMKLVAGGEKENVDTQAHAGAEAVDSEAAAKEDHAAADAELIVLPIKEIIANIVSITETGRKRSRFLKLNLALVYDQNVPGSEHVTEREVYLRDAFQNYIRQLTERDLNGSIGIVRLKSELLRRARAVAESDAPQELLIADIIVQ
jgi:flagellar FliL protein